MVRPEGRETLLIGSSHDFDVVNGNGIPLHLRCPPPAPQRLSPPDEPVAQTSVEHEAAARAIPSTCEATTETTDGTTVIRCGRCGYGTIVTFEEESADPEAVGKARLRLAGSLCCLATDPLQLRIRLNDLAVAIAEAANHSYAATIIVGHIPVVVALQKRFEDIRPGDLVAEISSPATWRSLGHLLRIAEESLPYSDDDPATETVVYIRALDGTEVRWTNAKFISLPTEQTLRRPVGLFHVWV